MRSDLYLTAIYKIINAIVAYVLNNPTYIRTVRKLLVLSD